jgi:hypothetical protein
MLRVLRLRERLSGDPLGWLHAQAQWGYSVGHRPWIELMRLLDGIERHGLYGYFFSDPARGVLLPARNARDRVRSAHAERRSPGWGSALGTYVAVSLYVPLSGNALEGIGRYAGDAVPGVRAAGKRRDVAPRARGAAGQRGDTALAASALFRDLASDLLGSMLSGRERR